MGVEEVVENKVDRKGYKQRCSEKDLRRETLDEDFKTKKT